MLICFALHCWRARKLTKHWESCFLWYAWLLHILFRDSDRRDALNKVIMCTNDIKYIQLKSCVSQWHTGHKFGAHGIHLVRQMHICVKLTLLSDRQVTKTPEHHQPHMYINHIPDRQITKTPEHLQWHLFIHQAKYMIWQINILTSSATNVSDRKITKIHENAHVRNHRPLLVGKSPQQSFFFLSSWQNSNTWTNLKKRVQEL